MCFYCGRDIPATRWKVSEAGRGLEKVRVADGRRGTQGGRSVREEDSDSESESSRGKHSAKER